jgi:hypothetical protein
MNCQECEIKGSQQESQISIVVKFVSATEVISVADFRGIVLRMNL